MSADSGQLNTVMRIAARWGVMSSAVSLFALVVFYYIGKHPFWIFPLFDVRILVMIIFLVLALREAREYHFNGVLFFWQGMTGSFVFLFVMAVFGYAGVWIFGLLEEGFLKDYIAQGMQQLDVLSPESIKEIGAPAVEEMRNTLPGTTLAWMARRYAVQSLAIGFFISIVISVVLRRQPQTL